MNSCPPRWTCIRIRYRDGLGCCADAGVRRRQNRLASPLTDGQASHGMDNQNGAQMAIDELNTQGLKIDGKAVKFELLAEGDQADPKKGPLRDRGSRSNAPDAVSGAM